MRGFNGIRIVGVGLSKHSTSGVTKPFPLLIPNTVIFHPVTLANG